MPTALKSFAADSTDHVSRPDPALTTGLFLIRASRSERPEAAIDAAARRLGIAIGAMDIAEHSDLSVVIAAEVAVDGAALDALSDALKALPGVASVSLAVVGAGRQSRLASSREGTP